MGDTIKITLDLTERTCSFEINHSDPMVVFTDLPDDEEFYLYLNMNDLQGHRIDRLTSIL